MAGWSAGKKVLVFGLCMAGMASIPLGFKMLPASPPPAVLQVAPTPAPAPVDTAAEKAAYERDRAALRKARPKTRVEVEKLLARDADSCIATGSDDICMWYYATKPPADGRDVLTFTFRDGKVLLGLD